MGGGPIDAFKMTRIRHGESIGMARGIQEVRTDLTRNARRNYAKRGLEKKWKNSCAATLWNIIAFQRTERFL